MKINRLLKIAIPFVIAVLILLFTISFLGEEQSVKSVRNDNNESETVQFPDFPIDNNEDTLEMEEEETVIDELKPYDTITFGEWHGELINWRVLEVRDQKVLVISERILALRQYEEIIDGFSLPTWAKCSLRSWLNNDFYQAAFSEEEQSAIILTSVNTPDFETEFETNHTDGFVEKTPVIVKGFDDTEDMVFCLSVEEAYKYFYSSEDRIAYLNVTQQDYDYAVQAVEAIQGSTDGWEYVFGGYCLNENSPKIWWLRSSTYVDPYGDIWIGSLTMDGDIPLGWPCGARPAIWLQLDADGVEIITH